MAFNIFSSIRPYQTKTLTSDRPRPRIRLASLNGATRAGAFSRLRTQLCVSRKSAEKWSRTCAMTVEIRHVWCMC